MLIIMFIKVELPFADDFLNSLACTSVRKPEKLLPFMYYDPKVTRVPKHTRSPPPPTPRGYLVLIVFYISDLVYIHRLYTVHINQHFSKALVGAIENHP